MCVCVCVCVECNVLGGVFYRKKLMYLTSAPYCPGYEGSGSDFSNVVFEAPTCGGYRPAYECVRITSDDASEVFEDGRIDVFDSEPLVISTKLSIDCEDDDWSATKSFHISRTARVARAGSTLSSVVPLVTSAPRVQNVPRAQNVPLVTSPPAARNCLPERRSKAGSHWRKVRPCSHHWPIL